MAGIGRNRVFDKASIEELKTQVVELMRTAEDVTSELMELMNTLIATAEEVPAEAKHGGLSSAARVLLGSLDPSVYTELQTKITEKLDKLNALVPAYDSQTAAVLSALSATAGSLAGMLEDLKGMIGQGSLSLSLEEFKGKLEEYEKKWQAGALSLEGKMLLAMTYLKGLVITSEYSRDPVNLSTGNFYYDKEDLSIRGLMPLTFHRYYNAMDKARSCLGEGWSHSDGEHLTFPEGGVIFHKADGREILLKAEGDALQDARTGKEMLKKEGQDYRYEEGNGELFLVFDEKGRLIKREDKNGNAVLFSHDEEGRIRKAQMKPAGEEEGDFPFLTYVYKEDGMLQEVADHTGRKISFFYMEGRLMEVTDPEGNVTGYRYGENGKIRAVKNPRGILTVRNEYDDKGRIVRQKFPDKGEMCYTYDDTGNRTILTERNNASITYVQDERLRNVKTIYHDSEESFTYNDKDLRTARTDRRGNTTRYTYDDKGNVTGIINAMGQKTSFTYNGEGKLLAMKYCGKEILKNTYDSRGRLIRTMDAMGRIRESIYDHRGLATQIKAPDGSVTEITYDKRGNIIGITDPYGAVMEYIYDDLNRVVSTTDGEGNTTAYEYDLKDRLAKVTNPAGCSRSYEYNESGKVIRVEDFDGGAASITYNNLNRPEILTDREGRQTKRKYDLMWNLAEEISPSGAVTRFAYDKDNRLERVELCMEEGKEPARVICYAHDSEGNLTGTRSGDAGETYAVTSYEYDALNRMTARVDEAGGRTSYEYDERGNLAAVTDPVGNRLTYEYNEAGEKIRETDALGNTVSYEYNELGQVCCITDPMGRKTVHTYAPGGRLTKTAYSNGRFVSYTYDKNGNVKTQTDETGYILTYAYDCMNRLTEAASSEGQKRSYEYDIMGNVTAMTDTNGNRTAYEYTMGGKLKTVTDALGNRSEYSYDALDNLILICQKGRKGEEDRITSYRRNPLGQVEVMTDAMGQEEHYTYDAMGRLKEKTDRDGYITAYRYAPDGKKERIFYGDGTSVEMEYDALRKLVKVKDWLGTVAIERDRQGRPLAITDHKGRKVSYEWGNLSERREMTYPDGRKAVYAYDDQMRLKEMMLPGAGTAAAQAITYLYDEKGRLSEKQFPEGLRTRWLYDGKGQLKELIHEDKEGVLDRYSYEYDGMGNKTGITRERRGLTKESGRYEYGYDALARLESVTRNGETLRRYEYDPFGNRTGMEDYEAGRKTASVYDALNRLVTAEEMPAASAMAGSAVTRSYGYDRRGNLVREERNGEFLRGYEYGAMDRMTRAWNRKGQESDYFYNGLGQRMGRAINGEEEDYLLDLSKPYHNLLGIGKGDSRQNFYFDNNVSVMEEEGNLHYYLQDELGSPLRVSGYGAGKETADIRNEYLTYGYDEFGKDLSKELEEAGIPCPYDRQGEEQPFGYTGYRLDDVSGTYFAQAREYRAESGRFTAEDVIKGNGVMPKTLNRYGYCWGNPFNYYDPTGMISYVIYDVTDDLLIDFAESEKERLEKLYDGDVIMCPVSSIEDSEEYSFAEVWVNLGIDENGEKIDIDEISFVAHGDKTSIYFDCDSFKTVYIEQYRKKVDIITLNSCNAGNIANETNIARAFLQTQEVNEVVAWDGILGYDRSSKTHGLLWDQRDFFSEEENRILSIFGIQIELFPRFPMGELHYKKDDNGNEIVENHYGRRIGYACPSKD